MKPQSKHKKAKKQQFDKQKEHQRALQEYHHACHEWLSSITEEIMLSGQTRIDNKQQPQLQNTMKPPTKLVFTQDTYDCFLHEDKKICAVCLYLFYGDFSYPEIQYITMKISPFSFQGARKFNFYMSSAKTRVFWEPAAKNPKTLPYCPYKPGDRNMFYPSMGRWIIDNFGKEREVFSLYVKLSYTKREIASNSN